ncbi:MAG: hypothetical protein FWF59_03650 [Turicibacter sp.]|nr:hypothetical protein [Turicibacter sp.]
MYNYGTGCGYNYGGYQVGQGYGNYQTTTCANQGSGGIGTFILVLFLLLVVMGLCGTYL